MRLSDIEILGAIGDSDTAAFAARSTGIHTYYTGEIDDDNDDDGDDDTYHIGELDDNDDDDDNISS